MSWAFFGVSVAYAVLVVSALVPVRRDPFAVISFALGWIPGEAPLQLGLLVVVSTAALAANGALEDWPGWVGLAFVALTLAGVVRLTMVAQGARAVVSRALAGATGGPVTVEGFDPDPQWIRWWRVALAIPFRGRGIRCIRNIDYWGDDNYRHKLDILVRRSPPPVGAGVLVYIHGGAWVSGHKRQQGVPMMHELARRGWVCVAINYRLSPRGIWPAHIVDCKRAVGWVREHIAEYGGDPGFIAVSGGSAGGHLCSLVALTPDEVGWQPGFEHMDTRVDACVPFYGVYDVTGAPDRSGAYGQGLPDLLARLVMKVSLDDDPHLFALASPDQRVTTAAPPMFVLHGTNDSLVPLPVARHFVDQLRSVSRAPVVYAELPGAQHAFDVMASIRCRHTTMGVVRFLESMRARAAGGVSPSPADEEVGVG